MARPSSVRTLTLQTPERPTSACSAPFGDQHLALAGLIEEDDRGLRGDAAQVAAVADIGEAVSAKLKIMPPWAMPWPFSMSARSFMRIRA